MTLWLYSLTGKRFADDGIMVAVGINIEGKKMIVGIEQTATENSQWPWNNFLIN